MPSDTDKKLEAADDSGDWYGETLKKPWSRPTLYGIRNGWVHGIVYYGKEQKIDYTRGGAQPQSSYENSTYRPSS